jgi:hypothetical protein
VDVRVDAAFVCSTKSLLVCTTLAAMGKREASPGLWWFSPLSCPCYPK